MSDSYVRLPVDGTGKLLDTSQLTVGINTVQRERMIIGDNTNNYFAVVDSSSRLYVLADQGAAAALNAAWPVELSDGTNLIGVSAHPVRIDPTGTTVQPTLATLSAAGTTQQTTEAAISFSASGVNTVVTGVAATKIRIWKISFAVAGATNITFQDSTPASFSGAIPMAANGSITYDFDTEPWFLTASGKAFVINSSNAVQVSGVVYFTQS